MPNPGIFLGSRKEFIEAQSAAYAAAVASGNVNDVVSDIQRRYFKRFPPALEHNVDPTKEWLDQVDDSAPDREIPAPNPDLPLDEFRRESLRYDNLKEEIKTRKEQIKRRLQYIYNKSRERETAFDKNSTDALSILAAKLSGASLTKPRKKTPANLWGPENRALVDPIFKDRVEKGGIPASQHLKLRSAIYKEMFDALPQAEQQEWQDRADREHDAQLKAQKDALNAPPPTTPADRQRIITAIPKLVEPILDLIAEYTGWKGSLILGGPEPADNGRLNMLSIHFGVTQGTVKMDFGRSERVVFKNHIQPAFGRFMRRCFTVEDCRAMALPADHRETTLSALAAEEDINIHRFDHDPHHTKSAPRPPKAKENATLDASSSLGINTALPGDQVKYGPPKGSKAKAQRVPPVGVAKDKILGPLPKASPATSFSAPDVQNQQSDQDASRETTHDAPPALLAQPSTSTRSPAPTPPPSRLPSPAPARTPEPTHVHPSSTGNTPNTSESSQDGAHAATIGSTAAAPGGVDGEDSGGAPVPEYKESVPGPDAVPPTPLPAALPTVGPPARPPGAATVPDDNTLDAMVSAKAKKRNTGSKGSKSTKRKADDAVADAPSKKSRVHTAPAFSLNVPDAAPEWVLLAISTFTSKALGDRWEAVVVEWLRFEEAQGFVKDGGFLSSADRPSFVAAWIKRGRKSPPREGIGAPDVFEADFMSWWRNLQPEERLNETDGQLTRCDTNWECLRISGTNGLLNVVGALFFWGATVLDNPLCRDRWTLALEDVGYALQQLNCMG